MNGTRAEGPRSVLVTGATGTVGSSVAESLATRDVAVRAGVRDVDAARGRFDGNVDLVAFDFDRPETWGAALGVDGLFLMRPPTVSTARVTDFADAAVRTGVERVAYLSVLGADRNPIVPHRRVESHLADADCAHAFLRASQFMQNFAEVHRPEIAERDEIYIPAGDGAMSFVDARDVGAVAATVLATDGRPDAAYDLTGPVALDHGEAAAIFSDVLGRRISYSDPSPLAFARHMRERGLPYPMILVMLGLYTSARLGFADRVTGDVERALDRPPTPLSEFVRDYEGAWTST